MVNKYQTTGGLRGNIIRGTLRALQCIFAAAIAGIYGPDLAHAFSTNSIAASQWVFAEAVAALSIITCFAHSFGLNQKVWWAVCVLWDWIVAVLWVALFGTFATLFLGQAGEG